MEKDNKTLTRLKNIEEILSSVRSLCKSEMLMVEDPSSKALLEASSDIINGLIQSFERHRGEDYESSLTKLYEYQKSADPWD